MTIIIRGAVVSAGRGSRRFECSHDLLGACDPAGVCDRPRHGADCAVRQVSDQSDILEAFVGSPGWQLFVEHVKAEWGPAGCWRKAKEVKTNDPARAVEQIDYTNEQVGRLMRWPSEEVERLKRHQEKPETVMSRGGYHP